MATRPVVFDIGANKGYETADKTLCGYHTTRPWVDNYRVICVEPTPALCEELRSRFSEQDVEVVEAAITDEPKSDIEFWISEAHTASTCSKERVQLGMSLDEWNTSLVPDIAHCYDPKGLRKIRVATTRVDTLVEKYGRPEFIKIDVEGYEHRVLNTFKENYCPISFEWNEQELDNMRSSMESCRELGYVKYWRTFGNLGIQEDIRSLAQAMYDCEYWRKESNWIVHAGALIAGAQSYETVMSYIDKVCTPYRTWEKNGTHWLTDALWGQIYAE